MDVVIKRSSRRRKTVQARLVEGIIEVLAPAHLSDAELEPYLRKLCQGIERQSDRHRRPRDDSRLEERARALNRRYFKGALSWQRISYSDRQKRWRGSCITPKGIIRISSRLKKMPAWVEDYVIVHELAHLQEPNHGKRFWSLVHRYPLAERARGFLMAADMLSETGRRKDPEG
ncbi:MAG TPA: M48 family metallopeptidase [Methanotrichaceae archaeon]|nr:M48 family metallopeptidase [Methanotrichaceae archaeon]HQF17700.1 M48 family metallopeptidase [Methanotrichaceae archaeon]HQI92264.1 M48 family metallopeptidase [Methanotrichaceae archaeon]HQJ29406.1 M48 family metallopeptidase [Methanotrichaceae archaeon]